MSCPSWRLKSLFAYSMGVSTANDEGYSAIHVDLVLEVETVDTFYEEEVALATSVATDAFRSVIEALGFHLTVAFALLSDSDPAIVLMIFINDALGDG